MINEKEFNKIVAQNLRNIMFERGILTAGSGGRTRT